MNTYQDILSDIHTQLSLLQCESLPDQEVETRLARQDRRCQQVLSTLTLYRGEQARLREGEEEGIILMVLIFVFYQQKHNNIWKK